MGSHSLFDFMNVFIMVFIGSCFSGVACINPYLKKKQKRGYIALGCICYLMAIQQGYLIYKNKQSNVNQLPKSEKVSKVTSRKIPYKITNEYKYQ